MGKTAYVPTHTTDPTGDVPVPGEPYFVQGDPNMSAEQRAKYDELIQDLRERQAEWERMTPEERAAEDASWQAFRQSMSDDRARAGARLLFTDDD